MKFLAALTFAITAFASAQDTPQDIPKKDLPKEAECYVCNFNGTPMGKEKPAGGLMYKGKAYYFCNGNEIKAFKKDPEAFMPLPLPRPMPEFNLTDTAGKVWNADAMKGKLVLLDYWATWCGPCREMFPMMEKIYAKYHSRGFELLSVSVDEKKPAFDKYMKDHKFPNPVIYDASGNFKKWRVSNIPATFLVKDGKVVAQWVGKVKEEDLSRAIETNLAK